MSFFPKSAVGLVGLFIFTAWLTSQAFPPSPELEAILDITTTAQTNIEVATEGITSESGGFSIIGSVGAVFSILFNLFIMAVGFIGTIFLSLVMFVTSISGLPSQISQIIIISISVGFIFALLSKLIETRG